MDKFFFRNPSKSHENSFFLIFLHSFLIHYVKASKKLSLNFLAPSQVYASRPKLSVFSNFQITSFLFLYYLLRYKQNSFGCFKEIQNFIFFKNTQSCFAHNSATKHRSEAVLYSKWTAGYLLSHHINTIGVGF